MWITSENLYLCSEIQLLLSVCLLSIEERLNIPGGELLIHTRPGRGTGIEPCIPLSPGAPV